MGWSLDYRGYSVDPPCEGFRRTWQGLPMLNGMPALTADTETGLRLAIDHAHKIRQAGTSPFPPVLSENV